jgi:thymidylate kinase
MAAPLIVGCTAGCAFGDEMDRVSLAHPLLRAAFAELDARGAPWALLRDADKVSAPGRDVDILISGDALERVDGALDAAGFVRMPVNGHGSHRFYVTYHSDDGRWIKVDAITEVAFGPTEELATDVGPVLLARRERIGALSVLHPADAFWHLALHHLLRDGGIPDRRRDQVASKVRFASPSDPLGALVDGIYSGMARSIPDLVARGDWDAAAARGHELRRAWERRARLSATRRLAVHRVGRRIPAVGRHLGVTLAVLGPDGAGKTSLANALLTTVPLGTRYVYLGMWRPSRLRDALRHLPGARLALVATKLAAKSALISYHRSLGRIVIVDRYSYDADVPSAKGTDWRARISAPVLKRITRDPDLIVLLDAPAEVMYARKGEHDLQELRRLRAGYLALADRDPRVVVVDATQPREDVTGQVSALLWARLGSHGAGNGGAGRAAHQT